MVNVLILGGIIVDQYYLVNEYPQNGTDSTINEAFMIPGGCSLNVAVTLKNLGNLPYIFSKIGKDEAGDQIIDYLNANAIETRFVKKVDAETDYCLVVVDRSAERTFFTHEKLDREIPSDVMDEMLNMEFQSVYVTGYFMANTHLPSNNLTLLRKLAYKGTKILFDPSAVAADIDFDVLKELVELSDIMTPNRYEAEIISKKLGASLQECVKDTCCLICKDGSQKLSIIYEGKTEYMQPYSVQVIDTTGAGDSFAAGVLYGLSSGLAIQQAVKIGMACGAITTTFKEPHGAFGISDINKIIEIGSVKYDK